MAQSNQLVHLVNIQEVGDAISAIIFTPFSTQLDDHQSYDELSEDDNELYGFLQTPFISSTPGPTSNTLSYSSQANDEEASTLHSPLASPTIQLAFSLPQLHIQSKIHYYNYLTKVLKCMLTLLNRHQHCQQFKSHLLQMLRESVKPLLRSPNKPNAFHFTTTIIPTIETFHYCQLYR